MATGSVEVVYRGVFQKNLAKNISRGVIEDAAAEVPPTGGTLAAFRRTERSYHGHKPYVGVRRYVMFNWMADHATARREVLRHRLSAAAKLLVPRGWGAA